MISFFSDSYRVNNLQMMMLLSIDARCQSLDVYYSKTIDFRKKC